VYIFRFSLKGYVYLLLSMLPFIIVLSFCGTLFYILHIHIGETDWLSDTSIKVLFFPSSVIFIQLILSFVSFYDIISLPLSDHRKRDAIVLRTLFVRGAVTMSRMKWLSDNTFLYSQQGLFRGQVPQYSALILSLFVFLYRKLETLYDLIENRESHIFRRDI
jgi:hypothetical protein